MIAFLILIILGIAMVTLGILDMVSIISFLSGLYSWLPLTMIIVGSVLIVAAVLWKIFGDKKSFCANPKNQSHPRCN